MQCNICGATHESQSALQKHYATCLFSCLSGSFYYGQPVWSDSPLTSHYSKEKMKEEEKRHAQGQIKLLTERILGRTNPVHQAAAGGPSTSVSVGKSFRKVIRRILSEFIKNCTVKQD